MKKDENLTKNGWRKKYRKLKVICLPKYMTGRKTLIFEDIKECYDYFGISFFDIRNLIESGKAYKQYYFDFYEE